MGDRSHEILTAVLERRHLFRTAVLSLSPQDREILVDQLADQLKKKAVDISGFVKLGGWPQVETWCAGDHLCVILAETRALSRSSSEAIDAMFKERLASGGPWHQLAFSLSRAGGPAATRWLAQRIKGGTPRDQFLNEIGVTAMDELYRGEHLTLFALSRDPILPQV
jgi:hypothetical protein